MPTTIAEPPFQVIRDTREKPAAGWTFRKSAKCSGTVIQTLKTGDYSLSGLDGVFTLERKGSISEFVGNLSRVDLPRFERELDRMKDFKRAYVVLEFSIDDLMKWPASSGLSWTTRRRIKTTGAFILKTLLQVQARHPHVHFVFAGDHGQAFALALLKQAWSDYRHLSQDPAHRQ